MNRNTRHAVAGVGAVVAAGILVIAAIHDQPKPAAPTARQTVTVTMTACVYGPHGEADRRCTPGVTSTAVTQDNLGSTICAKGWTAKQRPSTSVTNRIRDGQLVRYYGSAAPAASAIREDHLISLELGGAPRDPANLYPQRYADSIEKDREEDELHTRVCARTLELAEAQRTIVEHWTR